MTETDRFDVVRHYFRGGSRVIKRGLTWDEAAAHCADPETSYVGCRKSINVRRTKRLGPWFDGFVDALPRRLVDQKMRGGRDAE
jgi:hypothetical protein